MTEQTLREHLNKIRRLHREYVHDLERRDYLMTKATKVNAPLSQDKVKTSPSNTHSLIVIAIADLDTIIAAERERLESLKTWTRSFFEESELEREELEVMLLRYIDCLEWDEIAEFMYWSKRHVQRLHGSALAKLGTRWHTLAHAVARKV